MILKEPANEEQKYLKEAARLLQTDLRQAWKLQSADKESYVVR